MTDSITRRLDHIDAIIHSGALRNDEGFDDLNQVLTQINPWLKSFDYTDGIDVVYADLVPGGYDRYGIHNFSTSLRHIAPLWRYGRFCIAVREADHRGHYGRITINDDHTATWRNYTGPLETMIVAALESRGEYFPREQFEKIEPCRWCEE